MSRLIALLAALLVCAAPAHAATARITAPAQGATYAPPANVTVQSLARAILDGETLVTHRLYHNGALVASASISTSTTHTLSHTLAGLPGGTHQLASSVTNSAGQTFTSTVVSITVNVLPTVALTAPAAGASYTAPASILLTATASDSDGTIARIEFYNGSILLNSDTSPPYSYTWSNVPGSAANYVLKARAIDNLGGTTDSSTRVITVNALPTVSLSRAPSWATMNAPAAVTLTASASDTDGTIAKVEFYQGSTLLATDTVPPYSHALSGLATGSYSFTAKATDNRGAVTTSAANALSVVPPDSGPGAVTRRYVYDANQQLCKVIEPETGATVLDYDAAGNLVSSASGLTLPDLNACNRSEAFASDRVVLRIFDARNRLKTLSFDDTRGDQTWTYTRDGLPASVTTVNVPGAVHPTNVYDYNRRRLLKTELQALPAWYTYSLTYDYDRNAHLQTVHYPSGRHVDFAPNALGQATQARDLAAGGATYASAVTYHPNGAIAQFTYGNTRVHTMVPNARQLPGSVETSQGVLRFVYQYDAHANITSLLDQTTGQNGRQNRTLTYDGLDRLKTATSPMYPGGALYEYNALDNLTRVQAPGRDHYYCYDSANRLTNLKTGSCSGSTVTGLGYDVQGNVDNKDGQLFDFDTGNRLREVMGVERYRYDAYGRRILSMQFGNGIVFSQYGQSGQLLYQKNERTGQMKQIDHIYLAGSLIAQREQPIAGGAASVRYLHTDSLGSPVAVTNSAGTVIERMEYEPYGKQLVTTATIGQDRPGYTGHVRDAATGLIQAQQRYYWPEGGLFLSVDPISADPNSGAMFNRYLYANNNPYRFTDPDGRQALDHSAKYLDLNRRHGGDLESMNQEMSDGLTTGAAIAGGVALLAAPDPTDLAIGAALGRVASGLSASRGFSQAKRYVDSVADSLGPTGGRSGLRTTQYEGEGGTAGAAKLFNRLTRGDSVPRDGGRLGSLGDGSRVQTNIRTMRDGTKETSVRITSDRTGSRIKDVIKVRFREKPG